MDAICQHMIINARVRRIINGKYFEVSKRVRMEIIYRISSDLLINDYFVLSVRYVIVYRNMNCGDDSDAKRILISVKEMRNRNRNYIVCLIPFVCLVLPSLQTSIRAIARIINKRLSLFAIGDSLSGVSTINVASSDDARIA